MAPDTMTLASSPGRPLPVPGPAVGGGGGQPRRPETVQGHDQHQGELDDGARQAQIGSQHARQDQTDESSPDHGMERLGDEQHSARRRRPRSHSTPWKSATSTAPKPTTSEARCRKRAARRTAHGSLTTAAAAMAAPHRQTTTSPARQARGCGDVPTCTPGAVMRTTVGVVPLRRRFAAESVAAGRAEESQQPEVSLDPALRPPPAGSSSGRWPGARRRRPASPAWPGSVPGRSTCRVRRGSSRDPGGDDCAGDGSKQQTGAAGSTEESVSIQSSDSLVVGDHRNKPASMSSRYLL